MSLFAKREEQHLATLGQSRQREGQFEQEGEDYQDRKKNLGGK